MEIITTNRKAYFDYTIEKKYEAGIVLLGIEVKPLREKLVSIGEAWVKIEDQIPLLIGATITPKTLAPWELEKYRPNRDRRLLLKKAEIKSLYWATQQGRTIIPLRLYLNDHQKIKIEIAVAKGKKKYDKRETVRVRDLQRDGN